MWGTRDRLIPLAVGQAMVTELPHAVQLRFPDAGHALPEEAPEAFNRALVGFLLRGIPTPPADLAALRPGP
jgi:pimeloyl-ACP methyl ester carboxylesterase